VTLVHKYFEGRSPSEWTPDGFADPAAGEALKALIAAADTAAKEIPVAYEDIRLNDALEAAWTVVERANEFTDRAKPWELGKDPARRAELGTTLAALLETLRLVAVWTWPVLPAKCEQLWTLLGQSGTPVDCRGEAAAPKFGASEPKALGESVILFPRIELKEQAQTG
jgi:methionyl-tRNA synthetase